MTRFHFVTSPRIVQMLACAAALSVLLVIPDSGRAAEFESGRIQVQIAEEASIESIEALYGVVAIDSLPPLYLLRVPDGQDEQALIDSMSVDGERFVCVERAYRTETAEGQRQMIVAAVGGTLDGYAEQGLVERLHLPALQAQTSGENAVVAVLDTGVFAAHEALGGMILPGRDFVDEDDDPAEIMNGADDDQDGAIDEGAGHGTMVAGIVHLVAPQARILPVRVLDDEGRGSTFGLAKGIRYAVAQGAGVINMSLGLTERSGIVLHELAQACLASVAMVSAAGNLGVDTVQYFPASDVRVFMVAALDSVDVKTDFSNYHARVAVSAPGAGILGPYVDGGYAIGAGTSFAAAFISGQCAALLDLRPDASWEQLYGMVADGVQDIYSIEGNHDYLQKLGTGRVDGLATLAAAGIAAGGLAADEGAGDVWTPRVVPQPAGTHAVLHLVFPESSAGAGSSRVAAMRRFSLHDASGRLVREFAVPGTERSVAWDGCDGHGRPVPAGIYLLRLTDQPAPARTLRVILVR